MRSRIRRPFLLFRSSVFLALTLALLGSPAAQAQLTTGTPVSPTPSVFWGDIQPVDPTPLPISRDSSSFSEFTQFYNAFPWFMSVDEENGYLIVALAHGIQIWDLRVTPASPVHLGRTFWNDFPVKAIGHDANFPVRDVDAPAGVDTVAALAGERGPGMTIWNLTNKSAPSLNYQRPGTYSEVYAATLAGRRYAFGASPVGFPPEGDTAGGLYLYDITAAQGFNGCVDRANAPACPGVFKGTLGTLVTATFVDGTGNFLAVSNAVGKKLEIWNVANPLAPTRVLEHTASGIDKAINGVALWPWQGSFYLATVVSEFVVGQGTTYRGRIYNVSCIQTGCGGLGAPIWSQVVGSISERAFVTYSQSGGTPFLYFGSDDNDSGVLQREYLVDVTNPAAAVDVTPPQTAVVSAQNGNTCSELSSYWGWYYAGNCTGFNRMGPRRGKFHNDYFYRAAWSFMDVHQRTGGLAPVASFSSATPEPDGNIYVGSVVNFTDTSGGSPIQWSWTFQGGTPSSSSLRNPQGVTFGSVGNKLVSLTAFNANGSDSANQVLQVLDPAPVIQSVTSDVSSASVCSLVTFGANGASGISPRTFSWEVKDAQGAVVATGGNTPTFGWDIPPAQLPGLYTGEATLTNTAGSATAASGQVDVTALAALPGDGAFTPTNDVFVGPTVQFHVAASGATEWNWDFGDGTTTGWLNDPVAGPNPIHSYSNTGAYSVTVMVRNCIDGPRTSAALDITIDVVEPLIAHFAAQSDLDTFCSGISCLTSVGISIAFTDSSTGADFYDYDWNGDGDFFDATDQTSLIAPAISHTYTVAGTFEPTLRVRRGLEENSFTHRPIIVSSGNPPPPPPGASIAISGPSTGQINQSLSFSATASGCTASPTGWAWIASGGGAISGSGAAVSVSWPSSGTKTVTATNTGCGTAQGVKALSISNPNPPPGGGFAANFSFLPASAQTGQAVTFDASTSTGNPTFYSWDFGDGSPTADGATVSHTYTAAGTYSVTLTITGVTSQGSSCGGGTFCIDTETRTVIVTGAAPPPPPTGNPTVCPHDADAICLLDGRFEVKVDWINQHNSGETGIGHPLPNSPLGAQADTTGFFWFFNPNTTELIVKAIDGRAVTNAFWFFFGGLSDVEYNLQVTDLSTRQTKRYHNDPASICGEADTLAFPDGSASSSAQAPVRGGVISIDPSTLFPAGDGLHQTGGFPAEGCDPGAENLCLLGNRFHVEVDWTNQHDGNATGTGKAIPGTDETGYFWFFDPTNIELVTKMIDGSAVNGNIWLFYGALTDVGYEILVTDTDTEEQRIYTNDPGNICGLGDTGAF